MPLIRQLGAAVTALAGAAVLLAACRGCASESDARAPASRSPLAMERLSVLSDGPVAYKLTECQATMVLLAVITRREVDLGGCS